MKNEAMVLENVQPLPGLIGSKMGLYDSATGESVFCNKAIDITALCSLKHSERCIVKYANVVRGQIVQLCEWYKKDDDLGATIHWFINESPLHTDPSFVRHAHCIGIDALVLAKLLNENKILVLEEAGI